MNAIDLAGRVAVVTGGARGIGFAIAQRLLESNAEAVALWDVDGRRLEQAASELGAPGRVSTFVVDVSDEASVNGAARGLEARHGVADILVNNAGISGPTVPTLDYPVDAFRRVLDVDLASVFLCCRALVPGMVVRGYGRVVNVASIAGKEGNPNAPAYSAAKAGVIALTKTLGKELATRGVLVNCITPGAARTEIFDQISEEHISYMLSKMPMGRFLKVEEIAAMVAWLASDQCSFSTGAVFDLSGGRATY